MPEFAAAAEIAIAVPNDIPLEPPYRKEER
jgi:hypothetical protein